MVNLLDMNLRKEELTESTTARLSGPQAPAQDQHVSQSITKTSFFSTPEPVHEETGDLVGLGIRGCDIPVQSSIESEEEAEDACRVESLCGLEDESRYGVGVEDSHRDQEGKKGLVHSVSTQIPPLMDSHRITVESTLRNVCDLSYSDKLAQGSASEQEVAFTVRALVFGRMVDETTGSLAVSENTLTTAPQDDDHAVVFASALQSLERSNPPLPVPTVEELQAVCPIALKQRTRGWWSNMSENDKYQTRVEQTYPQLLVFHSFTQDILYIDLRDCNQKQIQQIQRSVGTLRRHLFTRQLDNPSDRADTYYDLAQYSYRPRRIVLSPRVIQVEEDSEKFRQPAKGEIVDVVSPSYSSEEEDPFYFLRRNKVVDQEKTIRTAMLLQSQAAEAGDEKVQVRVNFLRSVA